MNEHSITAQPVTSLRADNLARGLKVARPDVILESELAHNEPRLLEQDHPKPQILFTQPRDGADREPPYYSVSHEVNLSIRSDAGSRSRQLILFSLGVS